MVSIYDELGKADSALRDRAMSQLGITREMLERDMPTEQYLREIGQDDILRHHSGNKNPSNSHSSASRDVVKPVIWQADSLPRLSAESSNPLQQAYQTLEAALSLSSRYVLPGEKESEDFSQIVGKNAPKRVQIPLEERIKDHVIGGPAAELYSEFVLGPLVSIIGKVAINHQEQYFSQRLTTKIEDAQLTYCKSDLKIAAEYYRKNIGVDGKKNLNLQDLSPQEVVAFENLWKNMEVNGGVELLTRKIKQDISGITGLARLGNAAVSAAMKLFAGADGVPSRLDIEAAFKKVNYTGGVLVVLSALFPPAAIMTISGVVAANMALMKIIDKIHEWKLEYNNSETRRRFLYDLGGFAQQQIATHPDEFSDHQLQVSLQAQAEISAKKIALGHYDSEDIRTLVRYGNSAAYWLGERVQPDDPNKALFFERHQAMKEFLKDSGVLKNSDLLIRISRGSQIS